LTDINGHPIQPTLHHCVHNIREQIFHTTLQVCQESYIFSTKTRSQLTYTTTPTQNVIDDMKSGILNLLKFKIIALELAAIRFKCKNCYHHPNHQSTSPEPQDEDSNNDSCDNPTTAPDHYTITLPNLSSSRRPVSEIHLPEELRPDQDYAVTVDEPFDDYESALLILNDDRADIIPDTWTFDRNGMLVLDNHWSVWRDRGYRLKPGFFSMFRTESPLLVQEHLLPYLTPPEPEQPLIPPRSRSRSPRTPLVPYSASPSPNPSLSSQLPPTLPLVTTQSQPLHPLTEEPLYADSVQMGAEDMLYEAGRIENRPESQAVFVNGLSRDRKYIQLDLEKDGVELKDEDVKVSIDIDSVIWVTPNLRFLGPVYIHFLPLISNQPPFSVNNHVYVDILLPPSKEDREFQQISWRTHSYPLSAIPHTHFGHIGDGSGQFNVYVFFPRMIRKNPETGRMSTLIPREVQDLWFSEVVMPAFRIAMKDCPGTMEYLPMNIEQLRLRQGDRQKKSIPLTTDLFPRFQSTLRQLVSMRPDLLGRFGSFFFVVDSRGMKMLSKQISTENDKYKTLCSMIPQLDWDYMNDRSNGELFLDLGISYHPSEEEEEEEEEEGLVGLWRLERIAESYEIMGMKKGTTHHTSMLSKYGGRQAEMKINKSQSVHLCFRSSYNLCFEVVRLPGQANYLCSDIDAIKVNNKFLAGCNSWGKLFRNAEKRSYGVRDEVRGSGLAIVMLLDVALQKVRIVTSLSICVILTQIAG
jgi:hypothetical protein